MNIFLDDSDYERFQKLLFIINGKETRKFSEILNSKQDVWKETRGETLVDIGSYCLMPNHFHILIKVKNKEDTATFLQRLQMSYSKYFNAKNDRTGVLFQGKSKAKHISKDNYLKYIFSYIHLNPVKIIQKDWKEKGLENIEKTKEYLLNYKYSSYLDYLNEEKITSKILEKSAFPDYFILKGSFENEIFEWLNYGKDEKDKQK